MYVNPDIPTMSYGWNAFTYQPYDQTNNSSFYYNGGNVPNPFATTAAPSDSRRQIGMQFAQNWGQQMTPNVGGFPQSPYQPAQPQPTQTAAPVYPGSTFGMMNNQPTIQQNQGLFTPPSPYGISPGPQFDCIYGNNTTTWDKSNNQTPVWNNPYTMERIPTPPAIDWTGSQKQSNVYGYGYNNTSSAVTFAQPDDWMAQAKQNFAANL